MIKKQDTIKLEEILKDYIKQVEDNNDYVNHWLRRFFRCYLDGSYKGEKHYLSNIQAIKEANASKHESRRQTALKRLSITYFVQFLAIEFNEITPTTISKTVVNTLKKEDLDMLNVDLIDDMLDLIERN